MLGSIRGIFISTLHMDDTKEIIFIALSNQINLYSTLLEDTSLSKEEQEMVQYILSRSCEIYDSMSQELEDTPISRPQWKL